MSRTAFIALTSPTFPSATRTFRNCFGLVSRITDETIASRVTVSTERLRQEFYTWDPERSANARRDTERELRFRTVDAVQGAMVLWIKKHGYDPDTLRAARITIDFQDGSDPRRPAVEVHVGMQAKNAW